MNFLQFIFTVFVFCASIPQVYSSDTSSTWCSQPVLSTALKDGERFFSFDFDFDKVYFSEKSKGSLIIPFELRKNEEISLVFYRGFDFRFKLGKGGRGIQGLLANRPNVFFLSESQDKIRVRAICELSSEYDLLESLVIELVQIDPTLKGEKPPRSLLSGINLRHVE
jgi:hypothetical protein